MTDDAPAAPGATEASACRRTAMDLLARREHSRAELADKLAQRGFDAALVGDTLDTLAGERLLSDERFTEQFIESRIRRGQGPVRIVAELTRRGIAGADAREQLDALGVDWVALARETRDARFGAAPPGNYREWARQARFLQYRGFSSEQVRNALGDFPV